MRKLLVALVLLLASLPAARARADGISRIDKGTFQLSLDALLISTYEKDEGADSVFRANGDARLGLHYFLADNLALGLHAGLLVRKTGGTSRDLAFTADLSGRWYGRLGLGAFFAPELTLGGIFGDRDITLGGGLESHNSLTGFSAALRLPIAFFVSRVVSLEAGPQIIFSVASAKPDTGDATSVTALDLGFNVGFVYTF